MPPAETTSAEAVQRRTRAPWMAGLPTLPLLIALAGFNGVVAIVTAALQPPQNADVFGLWSFARFAWIQPGANVYDAARLQAFQDQLAPAFAGFYPDPYPPSFLWLISWMGPLPYVPARILWSAVGVAALAAAMALLFQPPWRRHAMAAPFLVIPSLYNAILGETGFFTSALLIAGLAWLADRPVLAGIAFGLLSAKPQLGVVVPFVLAGMLAWRAALAACVTALALAGAASAAFGAKSWLAWVQILAGYQTLTSANGPRLARLMANVQSAAASAHAPPALAWGLQAAASLAAGLITCLIYRRTGGSRLAAAAALAAVPLAAPHCYLYDLPELAASCLLVAEHYLAQQRRIPLHWIILFMLIELFLPAAAIALRSDAGTVAFELLMFVLVANLALRTDDQRRPA